MWSEHELEPGRRRMKLTASTLRAPADAVSGHRSWRGFVAGIALAAAVLAASGIPYRPHGQSGDGPTWIDFSLDGPDWTRPALWLAAAALVAAAIAIWAARRPLVLAAGLAMLAVGLAGAVATHVARASSGRVSEAAANAVPVGDSRDAVSSRLGAPAGHAVLRRPGVRRDCLLYQSERVYRYGDRALFALCFSDDTLVERVTIP